MWLTYLSGTSTTAILSATKALGIVDCFRDIMPLTLPNPSKLWRNKPQSHRRIPPPPELPYELLLAIFDAVVCSDSLFEAYHTLLAAALVCKQSRPRQFSWPIRSP